MKKIIFLVVMSLGAAALAETKEYSINHQCNSDELAGVVDIKVQEGGSFTLTATCLPAICSFRVADVRWPVSRPKKYKVFRTPDISFTDRAKDKIKFVKSELLHEFTANTKEDARFEIEKLMNQGLCRSIKYDLNFPEF